ncbi:MAG: DUF1998 domain-containing protein [Bacteroidaceae bacterium]|nr:DUF1998 domain-containing protein [Bacteroidaceae bacterium]
MKKIEEQQRGKLCTSYGAIGSLIETIGNGCLMIRPFDDWNLYEEAMKEINTPAIPGKPQPYWTECSDQRLLNRLQALGFTKLKQLFMPNGMEVSLRDLEDPKPGVLKYTVQAKRFPEWFYCPHCRRLQKYDEWASEWNNNPPRGKAKAFKDINPSCPKCSKGKKGYRELAQVRFVMASLDSGELKDLPWDTMLSQSDKDMEWKTSGTKSTDLTYRTSTGTAGLYGVRIEDGSGKSVNMAAVQQKYFVEAGKAYKMVLRSGNNVFFPYFINSIYIPKYVPSSQEIGWLKKYSKWLPITELLPELKEHFPYSKLTQSQIDRLIACDFDAKKALDTNYESEDNYRLDEMQCITDAGNYDSSHVYRDGNDFMSIDYTDDLKNHAVTVPIKGLYCLRRLKETKTMVAYSRIETGVGEVDKKALTNLKMKGRKEWWDVQSQQIRPNVPVGLQLPSNDKIADIKYLPAVEAFGEGFFVELDFSKILNSPDKTTLKTVLHTYSHLVMKELESQCGYPAASLSERLYFLPDADPGRFGFMIYAICGEDGGYGGITSLFNDGAKRICEILEAAKQRAQYCTNDPICENESGHCFACLDLPETSCLERNENLSRPVFCKYI